MIVLMRFKIVHNVKGLKRKERGTLQGSTVARREKNVTLTLMQFFAFVVRIKLHRDQLGHEVD